ncbi:hypothetical protein PR202_gb21426 [Eleusine coracana subsp. coracana]|uniref:Uncharacterized protein n=1 Tax=Eleusine coracana subsp. coracana TaxID=191504 RepID=A0AAV5FD38_ELECO|nr:hypothetical protein PR202_gb21426 [Eleusine coracana subsp. coracana]
MGLASLDGSGCAGTGTTWLRAETYQEQGNDLKDQKSSSGLIVLVLHLRVTSSSSYPLRPSDQAHDYLRFADVKDRCKSVLASAAGLSDDAYRTTTVKRELSFDKGDWHQAAGGRAPLVPFDVLIGRPQLDPLSLSLRRLWSRTSTTSDVQGQRSTSAASSSRRMRRLGRRSSGSRLCLSTRTRRRAAQG